MLRRSGPRPCSRAPGLAAASALALALAAGGCFVDRPYESTGDGSTTTTTSTTDPTTSTTTLPTASTTMDDPVVCGDFNIDRGEECDLGDKNGDGGLCTAECTLNVCGDGYLGPGEACDDGNRSNADACTNQCTVAACGDGYQQIGEGCDDGNTDNLDACTNECKLATCGDGMPDPGEGCDDGNLVDDDACTNHCTLPACGDGILQVAAGEGCDDGFDNAPAGLCSLECVPAECGDGVVQAVAGEECDDGDLEGGDGCSAACLRDALLAFVTEATYTGNLGGLAGADQRCQQEADAAGLPGDYLAWLADGQTSPAARFTQTGLPYIRADGQVLAQSWELLVNAGTLVPLDITAAGAQVGDSAMSCVVANTVWTNTNLKGEAHDVASHCDGWTSSAKGASVLLGRLDRAAAQWTNGMCVGFCDAGRRVYCFQQ